MVIDKNIIKELQTDDGHMGKISFLPEVTTLARREGTIEILKKMETVNIIHIGCCGHFHNIKEQIENHSHFHSMLVDSFQRVIGFDIDKKSVDYLSSMGISDVYAQNFVDDTVEVSAIISSKFGDEQYVILLPEVLEHIPNPVFFLEKIVEHHGKKQNKILISVPNAYGFGRVRDALFHNCESINMDHKYMFTPTTILKVMCMAGITPEEIHFFDLYKYSRILKKPMLGNTIVTIGRFE